MNELISVSLRYQALFVPPAPGEMDPPLGETTLVLLANLHKLGFGVSEDLKNALNRALPTWQAEVLDTFREVLGLKKNWTPLVKGWQVPTGESVIDHLITWFVNLVGGRGTTLPCGHLIPAETFPLERYNGCPFCGTPFEFGKIEYSDQGSSRQVLERWTDRELDTCLLSLLQSKTALDATQRDSLEILLRHRPLPNVDVAMKETSLFVVSSLIENGCGEATQRFMSTPTDVLRYLWFKKTGNTQIVEPRTIIQRTAENNRHLLAVLSQSESAREKAKQSLKLKYTRAECRRVAGWLNHLAMSPVAACEIMHPKRRMWVRFIRALRLMEYAAKPGFENLAALLKCFHEETYPVFAGQVEGARLRRDAIKTFRLLQQRPGLFARSLFANMLWFGPEEAISAFTEVIDQVPARLVFSLQTMATHYFEGDTRLVKPLGSAPKKIPVNPLLALYEKPRIVEMLAMIEKLCLEAIRRRFAAISTTARTMYIDPFLFKMPVSIGERSETVLDLPSALAGARFPIAGDSVRLFMQWGAGLPAQHMDMDLSCRISFEKHQEICAYHSLVATGCKHSGDIRHIPEQIGTAEYIEINLPELEEKSASYVVFICNAYSWGSLTPEMVVGWMNSAHEMKISEETGVAYDPSCVMHQVRITRSLTKGLVFGVLDVSAREIIWLEMPFSSQIATQLDTSAVQALLARLNSRLSIGNLLKIKAEAQGLTLLDSPGADEDYTTKWGIDAAAVTQLLVD